MVDALVGDGADRTSARADAPAEAGPEAEPAAAAA